LKATGNRTVLVTRGAKGMILFRKGALPFPIPAFGSGEVADVTGAGDTVIATYTLALLAGGSPEEAAVIANTAAGIVVMKYGTATVTPKELVAALRSGSPA
jgi:bifunctional ADP-heptose synthase (sugar kinase/adenylyltransferase)